MVDTDNIVLFPDTETIFCSAWPTVAQARPKQDLNAVTAHHPFELAELYQPNSLGQQVRINLIGGKAGGQLIDHPVFALSTIDFSGQLTCPRPGTARSTHLQNMNFSLIWATPCSICRRYLSFCSPSSLNLVIPVSIIPLVASVNTTSRLLLFKITHFRPDF